MRILNKVFMNFYKMLKTDLKTALLQQRKILNVKEASVLKKDLKRL